MTERVCQRLCYDFTFDLLPFHLEVKMKTINKRPEVTPACPSKVNTNKKEKGSLIYLNDFSKVVKLFKS